MSRWVDEKYIGLIANQLGRFHKQGRSTYAFRCPFCGDSQKQSSKTRGYFFFFEDKFLYKCHNCNISMSLPKFLRERSPDLFREYQLELFRDQHPTRPSPAPEAPVFRLPSKTKLGLPTIASLPADHPAVVYCRGRGLPDAALQHLHFTDTWQAWITTLGWDYIIPEDHAPRLVLPWYSRDGELLGAQARQITPGVVSRYITFKSNPQNPKVYGLDRVVFYKPVFVVEGPLDSWFLPNCIASMDSDLLRIHEQYLSHHTAVYIWDNEPRNLTVSKNLKEAIMMGLPVVVWPEGMKEKDLNEMSQAGHDVEAVVKAHTFRGLRAELEYMRWKRL